MKNVDNTIRYTEEHTQEGIDAFIGMINGLLKQAQEYGENHYVRGDNGVIIGAVWVTVEQHEALVDRKNNAFGPGVFGMGTESILPPALTVAGYNKSHEWYDNPVLVNYDITDIMDAADDLGYRLENGIEGLTRIIFDSETQEFPSILVAIN